MIRVLVFPCGSEIGLEVHRSLKDEKNIKLYGANSVSDHGKFVYKNYIEGVPFIDTPEFFDHLNKIISDNKIDFIIPAHDSVVLKLAEMEDKLNCKYIGSKFETADICRSKLKTYQKFDSIINCPKVFPQPRQVTQEDFPVFLKPEVGQGSKGCHLVNNFNDLNSLVTKNQNLLILEYLPGEEYTIDCFTDSKGNLLYSGCRKRARTLNGISTNSYSVMDTRVDEIAYKINETLEFRGSWFFQLKENANGDLSLLEIAPRTAGTMSLNRNRGVNFPLMSILDRQGQELEVLVNKNFVTVDRCFRNRYEVDISYKNVFVDFDDTLVIKDKVNTEMISFLYQCVNEGKKITLITRHKEDLNESLDKYKISKSIFDKIIWIKDKSLKSSYIKDKQSIFIDDSFSERKDVSDNLGISVFSVDMIESLMKHKK